MGIEIERKFLVRALPDDVERFPFHEIEQGYLCRQPAVRVRREDDSFYMTYKGLRTAGVLAQEEYNLPLTAEAYAHLLEKADGLIIKKKRVLIPLNEDAFSAEAVAEDGVLAAWLASGKAVIELDIFRDELDGIVVAEVEFPTEKASELYRPAGWFEKDVTDDRRYSNASLAFSGGLMV